MLSAFPVVSAKNGSSASFKSKSLSRMRTTRGASLKCFTFFMDDDLGNKGPQKLWRQFGHARKLSGLGDEVLCVRYSAPQLFQSFNQGRNGFSYLRFLLRVRFRQNTELLIADPAKGAVLLHPLEHRVQFSVTLAQGGQSPPCHLDLLRHIAGLLLLDILCKLFKIASGKLRRSVNGLRYDFLECHLTDAGAVQTSAPSFCRFGRPSGSTTQQTDLRRLRLRKAVRQRAGPAGDALPGRGHQGEKDGLEAPAPAVSRK